MRPWWPPPETRLASRQGISRRRSGRRSVNHSSRMFLAFLLVFRLPPPAAVLVLAPMLLPSSMPPSVDSGWPMTISASQVLIEVDSSLSLRPGATSDSLEQGT